MILIPILFSQILIFGLCNQTKQQPLCSNLPQVSECPDLAIPVIGYYDDFTSHIFTNDCQACKEKGIISYEELVSCSPKFLRTKVNCASYSGSICGIDETNQLHDFENLCYGCSNPTIRWYIEGKCPGNEV